MGPNPLGEGAVRVPGAAAPPSRGDRGAGASGDADRWLMRQAVPSWSVVRGGAGNGGRSVSVRGWFVVRVGHRGRSVLSCGGGGIGGPVGECGADVP
jgi:hypothetical protein